MKNQIKSKSNSQFREHNCQIEFNNSLEHIISLDVYNADIFDDGRGRTGDVSVNAKDYTHTMSKNSQELSKILSELTN